MHDTWSTVRSAAAELAAAVDLDTFEALLANADGNVVFGPRTPEPGRHALPSERAAWWLEEVLAHGRAFLGPLAYDVTVDELTESAADIWAAARCAPAV